MTLDKKIEKEKIKPCDIKIYQISNKKDDFINDMIINIAKCESCDGLNKKCKYYIQKE